MDHQLGHFAQSYILNDQSGSDLSQVTKGERGQLLSLALFLQGVSQALAQQRWLSQENSNFHFEDFLTAGFRQSPKFLNFLQDCFRDGSDARIRDVELQSTKLAQRLLRGSDSAACLGEFSFARGAVFEMARLMGTPCELVFREALYRSFDPVDEAFAIDYSGDAGMELGTGQVERLYEGSGSGVQTSYTTLLIALQQARIPPGGRLIDLGCGFGRLGFVTGILRPDLDFIGYEYVGHRVLACEKSAQSLGLDRQKIRFFEQNLGAEHFQIPEADAYYLYDPFSEVTYRRVLRQLIEHGRKRRVVVLTKGNAKAWLVDAIKSEGWVGPILHDAGTLGLFASRA